MPTVYEKKPSGKIPPPLHHDHMGPLTYYARHPRGVRFETQKAEETVVLFMRQHLIVNLGWMLLVIFLSLVPIFVFPAVVAYIEQSMVLPDSYVLVGTLFWYLGTLGFALAMFLGWFFNIYIVTNERVIDIDFYYLLYKRFSQAELGKIQDLSYTSGGVIATFFNYGNVSIQTAGELPNLEFDKVPFPEKVAETIRNLQPKR